MRKPLPILALAISVAGCADSLTTASLPVPTVAPAPAASSPASTIAAPAAKAAAKAAPITLNSNAPRPSEPPSLKSRNAWTSYCAKRRLEVKANVERPGGVTDEQEKSLVDRNCAVAEAM